MGTTSPDATGTSGEKGRDQAPDAAAGPAPALHVSTGRLHGEHARTVQAWRAALRRGGDERVRASTSDCLAAAVAALLRSQPDPIAVARTAEAGRRANAAGAGLGGVAVSCYVGGEDVDAFLALLERARQTVLDLAEEEIRRLQQHDGALSERRVGELVEDLLHARGLPAPGRAVPRGTVVRLAVQQWSTRSPTDVATAAAAWAAEHHQQLHRARADMRDLR